MSLPKINPTTTKAWKKLQEHYKTIANIHMKDLFVQDSKRANEFSITWEDFYIDFSKNRITKETFQLLLELAKETKLDHAIQSCFLGEKINETEDRAVLHTALRASEKESVSVDGENIIPEIQSVKTKIKHFSNNIITGNHRGYTGKSIKTIVNIGIGGSDLGPLMVVDALKFYRNHLSVHFVNNIDGDHVNEVLKKLDPETTLFVIVSKTFTTQETLTNAQTIRSWFLQTAPEDAVAKHFVAVSTNIEKVEAFGIDDNNIFPMWNWVGGRYSLWSAVGLSISLTIGYNNFELLLKGAYKADVHFNNEPFEKNIPVVLALIGIWYNNFFNAESEAIIPYSQYLNLFPIYLQQTAMESNGKSIDRSGLPVDYQTGTLIWGTPGTNSQHSFFQLLHQGTKLIPTDFIGFREALHDNKEHQDKLMSNFIGQTKALLEGKTEETVIKELNQIVSIGSETKKLVPFKIFDGNKPTNTIFIDKLTPESLGKLIAIYEHKIFVQGIIWNIFSFDQFGVELGKQIAGGILEEFADNSKVENHDSSTLNIIKQYKA